MYIHLRKIGETEAKLSVTYKVSDINTPSFETCPCSCPLIP